MSHEKICFNKRFIAFAIFGVLIVGSVVLFANFANRPTSTNTRAATGIYPTQPITSPTIAPFSCTSVGLFDVEKNVNGSTQAFVTDYQKTCRDQRGLWNGGIGIGVAKCYTRTAVCAASANCTSARCLIGYDNKAGCVFEPADMTKCSNTTSAQRVYTLDDLTCNPSKKLYVTDGKKNFIQGSKVCMTPDWVSYCCNGEISPQEARANNPKILDCASNPTFGWGPAATYLDVRKWTEIKITTCYQTNASDGVACVANRPVAREFCQCHIDNKGNINSATCGIAYKLNL